MNNAEDLLGRTAIDKITGFKGTITGYASYLTGCDQLLVLPVEENTTNKYPSSHWLDILRLEILEEEPVLSKKSLRRTRY